MTEYIEIANAWLDQMFAYGDIYVYLVLAAICFMENITPPIPGDSFIVAAGGLVAAGRLDTFGVMLASVIGGMSSVMVIYYIGRRYGREFFIRKNYRLFSANDIVATEKRFERWGGLLLIASRFVVGFRVILAGSAGMGRYPAIGMLIYSTISYVAYAGLLLYLGYALVDNYAVIEEYFKTYEHIGWPIVIGVIAFWAIRRIIKIRKNHKS